MSKQSDFIRELRELMQKYNASVNFYVHPGSDTYGLSDETMIVMVDDKIAAEVDGWGFDHHDLKG
jgi:hypothetical protein